MQTVAMPMPPHNHLTSADDFLIASLMLDASATHTRRIGSVISLKSTRQFIACLIVDPSATWHQAASLRANVLSQCRRESMMSQNLLNRK
jgi:hypothetical protein